MVKKIRQRAIDILYERYPDQKYLFFDYLIDDECRQHLNLPSRPVGTDPYVGWMVGTREVGSNVTGISLAGIELIKSWEGLRTKAYLCPGNVWTIGYGHTRTARSGMIIDESLAEQLLQKDLEVYEDAVRKYVTKPTNQNQFDALVSFVFNVGVNAFMRSTLLKKLNAGDYRGAANEFHRWTLADGQRLQGLIARREDESNLFLS